MYRFDQGPGQQTTKREVAIAVGLTSLVLLVSAAAPLKDSGLAFEALEFSDGDELMVMASVFSPFKRRSILSCQ